jgi:hypothetical protein
MNGASQAKPHRSTKAGAINILIPTEAFAFSKNFIAKLFLQTGFATFRSNHYSFKLE